MSVVNFVVIRRSAGRRSSTCSSPSLDSGSSWKASLPSCVLALPSMPHAAPAKKAHERIAGLRQGGILLRELLGGRVPLKNVGSVGDKHGQVRRAVLGRLGDERGPAQGAGQARRVHKQIQRPGRALLVPAEILQAAGLPARANVAERGRHVSNKGDIAGTGFAGVVLFGIALVVILIDVTVAAAATVVTHFLVFFPLPGIVAVLRGLATVSVPGAATTPTASLGNPRGHLSRR